MMELSCYLGTSNISAAARPASWLVINDVLICFISLIIKVVYYKCQMVGHNEEKSAKVSKKYSIFVWFPGYTFSKIQTKLCGNLHWTPIFLKNTNKFILIREQLPNSSNSSKILDYVCFPTSPWKASTILEHNENNYCNAETVEICGMSMDVSKIRWREC